MTTRRGRPRDWLATAADRHGESVVALWCAGLVTASVSPDDPSGIPLVLLGGSPATYYLERLASGNPEPAYWPRVWGARGLLYVWDDRAEPAVLAGLQDDAWRVREMSAKVVRHRQIGAAAGPLATLCADENSRVQVAALRALARVGEGEHAAAMHEALHHIEPAVAAAADAALTELGERLDRDTRLTRRKAVGPSVLTSGLLTGKLEE